MNARLCGMLLVIVTLPGCVAVGATSGRVAVQEEKAQVHADIGFTDRDRQVIRNFYKTSNPRRGGKLPAGFARHDALPAGLGESLPVALSGKLSPLASNYVRLKVGQDVVLVNAKTRVVADILYNAGN